MPAGLIATHGAVSESRGLRAMALGAVAHSSARKCGVTGIAGSTGGTADKPVGTVWFGWNVNGTITTATRRFDGDRCRLCASRHWPGRARGLNAPIASTPACTR